MIRTTLLLCIAWGSLTAQSPPNSTAPLQHGSLVVWFVDSPVPAPPPQPYAQYREQTSGSFGTPASTMGQSAGSIGINPSNLPSNISSKPASEVGQTSGSFGTSSSNIGQTSASYGQPASALGAPAPDTGPPVFTAPALTWVATSSTQLGRAWPSAFAALRHAFPALHPHVAFIKYEDLQDRLAALEGTPDYPDVLVGSPLPLSSQARVREATLAHLGRPVFDPDALVSGYPQPADAAILRRAPHPREARAFVVALSESICTACAPRPIPEQAALPARLAVTAVEALLQGGSADTDPAFANPISPGAATALTLWPQSASELNALTLHTDVLLSAANERFAVVALRTVAESAGGFGVVHPLVILRLSDTGHWRILQISTDLQGILLPHAFNSLIPYAEHIPSERLKPVTAITQAAPLDGDTRSRTPDLWWDDPGTASMLVVESQMRAGPGTWADSHLLLVPDHESRLRVRVTASFATQPTVYRWRVWSLGSGGVLAITPWRSFTVVP